MTKTHKIRISGASRNAIVEADERPHDGRAHCGYRGLMRNQPVVIPGRHNRSFALLSKLLPGRMVLQIVKRAQEQKDAE